MENGEETFASPAAGAAAEFEFDLAITNGGNRAKPHDADEIDALRAAKRDLEEKLDAVGHQNRFLSSESRRLEVLVSQARDEIASFEHAAAANENEAATLRAEVKRLQDLLAAEKSGHEAEMRKGAGLGDQLQTAYQEKVALEEEIEALKASAAAAATSEKEKGEEKESSAAPSAVAPKEVGAASPGLVAAAAAGAAATAAIAVVFLNLKR